MLSLFLESIKTYCTLNFDILIICDKPTHDALVSLPIMKDLPNISFHYVPKSKNLYHALLGKCDIYQFSNVSKYEKVLYLDCDVIVQRDLMDLFKKTPIQKNILYAPQEGEIKGKFWYLDSYTEQNVARLEQHGVQSFNSGTFMFVPTLTFLKHFEKIKIMATEYKGKKHFYDQSFLNYYFNTKNISSTKYMSDIVKIFPDEDMYYPNKYIIHFAGIGRYREKSKIMRNYLKVLKKTKLS
jgi:lipopolysaccharide biosynthesis glycosyltransferase